MNSTNPISLQFAIEVSPRVRSRISYAFRVFAAIYGHAVVEPEKTAFATPFFYGKNPPLNGSSAVFHIPHLYSDSSSGSSSKPAIEHRYANKDIYLSFGIDPRTKRPDWLGEVFRWISSDYESDISARDSVGRIPCSSTIFKTAGISPRKPHASLLMAWMENEFSNRGGKEAFVKAPSPFPGVEHAVISSHDIDFYFLNRFSTLTRLGNNLGIAVTLYRDWSYFADNSKMILQLLQGRRAGDFLPSLFAAGKQNNFRSTVFVVSRRGNRRDPDYRLGDVSTHFSEAAQSGFSVGLHGSYRSIIEDQSLPSESRALAAHLNAIPLANRQHWLRFSRHADLFSEIERAGFLCDSTLGFPDTVGFRNGASFAFPPYDFANERPHRFLEIPLVLMDGSLEATARTSHADPQQLAEEVLGESRKYGWGGVSLLWHNPFEPLSVPTRINQVFWNCLKQKEQLSESWMNIHEFLAGCLSRYQNAGLFEGVSFNGESSSHERPAAPRSKSPDPERIQSTHVGAHSD